MDEWMNGWMDKWMGGGPVSFTCPVHSNPNPIIQTQSSIHPKIHSSKHTPHLMSNLLSIISLLTLSLLFLGCNQNVVYEREYEIANTDWTYADTLTYTVDIADTLAVYDLFLEVEHTREYPFENMYISIHTQFPEGQRLTETVSLELADEAGIWMGDCDGEGCTIDIPIQQGAYFSQPGQYIFTIEQYMRRDPLPGVKSIAFRVEETGARSGE